MRLMTTDITSNKMLRNATLLFSLLSNNHSKFLKKRVVEI
jgi:hypothetical protein